MTTMATTVSIGKKPNPVTLTDTATSKVAELLAQEEGALTPATRAAWMASRNVVAAATLVYTSLLTSGFSSSGPVTCRML